MIGFRDAIIALSLLVGLLTGLPHGWLLAGVGVIAGFAFGSVIAIAEDVVPPALLARQPPPRRLPGAEYTAS